MKGNTMGKGEKYRFNMNMPMRQKEYLSEIAWRNRVSITEYIKRLIDADMNENQSVVRYLEGVKSRDRR